jgi:hypothetical protein
VNHEKLPDGVIRVLCLGSASTPNDLCRMVLSSQKTSNNNSVGGDGFAPENGYHDDNAESDNAEAGRHRLLKMSLNAQVFACELPGSSIQVEATVEFRQQMLDNMKVVSDSLLLPYFAVADNDDRWPALVCKDVKHQFHDFSTSLDVALYSQQGKVLLPPPLFDFDEMHLWRGAEEERRNNKGEDRLAEIALEGRVGWHEKSIDSSPAKALIRLVSAAAKAAVGTIDQDAVHTLETTVVSWAEQVEKVVKLEPDDSFHAAYGTFDEIWFWKLKAQNLEDIKQQLGGHMVQQTKEVGIRLFFTTLLSLLSS